MTNLHIKPQHFKAIQSILAQYVPQYEVWAFGSRVHGRQLKPFSDLDLAVINNTEINPAHLRQLKEAFSESNLPFRVDVVDWAAMQCSFQNIILQEHVVLKRGPTPLS